MTAPPNRAARRALTAEVHRALTAEVRAGAEMADRPMDLALGALVETVKRGLPLGWDVTLVATRHAGDGRATTKLASTLPPKVRDAVLVGLGEGLRAEYEEQRNEGEAK